MPVNLSFEFNAAFIRTADNQGYQKKTASIKVAKKNQTAALFELAFDLAKYIDKGATKEALSFTKLAHLEAILKIKVTGPPSAQKEPMIPKQQNAI